MEQLTTFLGRMPRTPSKLALGYTLCRQTKNSDYARFQADLSEMKLKDIPFDADCISQALLATAFRPSQPIETGGNFEMSYELLKQSGKKFFLAQPPHVDINLPNLGQGSFIKDHQDNSTTQDPVNYQAKFNGVPVYLPDFANPTMTDWWSQQLENLLSNSLKQRSDGFILIHNSPRLENASRCDFTDKLAFAPSSNTLANGQEQSYLSNQTICPVAMHYTSPDAKRKHIKMHNDFGTSHAKSMTPNLVVFSHSSAPGISGVGGVFAG